jgi:hypothetical protein
VSAAGAEIGRERVGLSVAAGLAVSVLLHAGAAVVVGVAPGFGQARAVTASLETPDPEAERAEDEVELGMEIPRNASIAWLGVVADPEEGIAPESEVEQAALSPTPGAAPSEAEAAPVEAVEPLPEPAEPTPVAESEPDPAGVEPPVVMEPSPVIEPAPARAEPVEERPIAARVEHESAAVRPEAEGVEEGSADGADAVAAEAAEHVAEEVAEVAVMGPPAPTPEEREAAEAAAREAAARESAQAADRRPAPEGAPGELDERAADAAMRRRAAELDIDRLGRPLQASGGLEITTVRPVWSLQVRNAYSPRRNPYMEIRFGADGRVTLARFVPLEDGTVGSGYGEVDQPLLNAVYRWRGKGEAIERLAGAEELTIVMRFLIVPPVPGERDGE